MLRIFIALKNSSPLATFEPMNLGTGGKHANQETTEDEQQKDAKGSLILLLMKSSLLPFSCVIFIISVIISHSSIAC
jgi:hypothetical protein